MSGPRGYDKSDLSQYIFDQHRPELRRYISLNSLEEGPRALLQALAQGLDLQPSVHELPTLLRRDTPAHNAQYVAACAHDLQRADLHGRLLILDGVESLTPQTQALLTEILLRTSGRAEPLLLLSTMSEETLPLRDAGVPITWITEVDLALTEEEQRQLGVSDHSASGWPLAARLLAQNQPHKLKLLLTSWLMQLEPETLRSLENASIDPNWPLSATVMAALNIDPNFISDALGAGLPILRKPDGRFQPLTYLQDLLQTRLRSIHARYEALQRTYAGLQELDSGRVLRTLLQVPNTERLAQLIESQTDLPAFARDHQDVLLQMYGAQQLNREPALLVLLAEIRSEDGDDRQALMMLERAEELGAGTLEVTRVRAALWQRIGRVKEALEEMERAVTRLQGYPAEVQATVYAQAALMHVTVLRSGQLGADLYTAQQYAQRAIHDSLNPSTLVIAQIVLMCVRAHYGDWSVQHRDTVVHELRLQQHLTPDGIRAAMLLCSQLADHDDHAVLPELLQLLERTVQADNVVQQVELQLLRSHLELRAANPGAALLRAQDAVRTLNTAQVTDASLQRRVIEQVLITHLYTMTPWPHSLQRSLLHSYRKLVVTLQGQAAFTADALQTWHALLTGQARLAAQLEKMLPDLLEVRSPAYLPVLTLLIQQRRITDSDARLQEARTAFGAGALNSTLAMLAPDIDVPTSPRLDITLFGVTPGALLNGTPLPLSPRALVILAVLALGGNTSRGRLMEILNNDHNSEASLDQALRDLRGALGRVLETSAVQTITQASGPRGTYGLQRYRLQCDALRLISMSRQQRRELLALPFMGSFAYQWAVDRRAEYAAMRDALKVADS
ncbi:hypothetical protein GCM10008957_23340 [Deinococcus ruber]|uniref:Uncharacterized protein n=1 Tax=Deinococcus ruber TaxID=1848197 RepID=A0A918C8B5_9DEIO|nr:hypothetical protein GCM10008957_23340 [Deinococcus ruber]